MKQPLEHTLLLRDLEKEVLDSLCKEKAKRIYQEMKQKMEKEKQFKSTLARQKQNKSKKKVRLNKVIAKTIRK